MAGHLTTASPAPPSTASPDLRRRVLDCISRLADRDTQPQAAAELETIAVAINLRSVASFISWIRPPEESKSAVRITSLRLLAALSRRHGGALVHALPKMVAAVCGRLRDGDSATRAACVEAISAMAVNIEAPFSSFSKLLVALFSEQDSGAQAGAALCLAAAVDGGAFKDAPTFRRLLLKLVKLLSSDGFKAKAALLALIGSVIESGGASSNLTVKEAAQRVLECVGSREWATRKAAAGALSKLAVTERDVLPEFKASCLKVLEERRFDKVKAVREAMNDLVEKWKEIPDVSYEVSPPPFSHSSCIETVSSNGGCIPCVDSHSKWHSNSRRFSMPAGSLSGICKESGAVEHSSPSRGVGSLGGAPISRPRRIPGRDESDGRPESRDGQAGFIRNSDSCSPLSQEGIPESVESYNSPQKQAHDLASIGKQLVHIEHRQSCLLELIQKMAGTCEEGMSMLERRVYRLELMLEKVLSPDPSAAGILHLSEEELPPTCCVLPGADFFSSKFKTMLSAPLPTNGAERKQKGGSFDKLIVNPLAA